MKISIKETQLGLRDSTTRLPFRYGNACLTQCPQAIFQVLLEVEGKQQTGFSGDCLPPSWFDKSPGKTYEQQLDDMKWVIDRAATVYRELSEAPSPFFDVWRETLSVVHSECATKQLPHLLASFGASVVERAVIDAICRANSVSFANAIRENIFGINPDVIHPSLAGLAPRDWLPQKPCDSIYVRHTVGLSDPLTDTEIPSDERLNDGFPQSLEEYIKRDGLRYLKIKVANNLDADIERLTVIAGLLQSHLGEDFGITLDGNEQYSNAADFDALVDAIRSNPTLAVVWKNIIAIEQPLERSIALSPEHTGGIRELSLSKPVIIDESDGTLHSYQQAIDLGYHGTSSKSCKGAIKSILNAGLTWLNNDRGQTSDYIMTGEDLCTVGIVPVQSDLCLVATLGLEHVERNGHHYHRGLSYLPTEEQAAALAAHPDLYAEQHGIVAPKLRNGRFEIASLQCVGFGFEIDSVQPSAFSDQLLKKS